MVRLSLWFVALELEFRRSLRILLKRSVRSVLLGVEVRMGKKVCSRLVECQHITCEGARTGHTLWNQLCPFSSAGPGCLLSFLEAQAPEQSDGA